MELRHFQIYQIVTTQTPKKTLPHLQCWPKCFTRILRDWTEESRGDFKFHHAQIFLHKELTVGHVKKQWSIVSTPFPQKTQSKDWRLIPLFERLNRVGIASLKNRQTKIFTLIGMMLLQNLHSRSSPWLLWGVCKMSVMSLTEKMPFLSQAHFHLSGPLTRKCILVVFLWNVLVTLFFWLICTF